MTTATPSGSFDVGPMPSVPSAGLEAKVEVTSTALEHVPDNLMEADDAQVEDVMKMLGKLETTTTSTMSSTTSPESGSPHSTVTVKVFSS